MNERTAKKRVPKILEYLDLSGSKVIGVYGDTGSGKTSLCYGIIDNLIKQTEQDVYILKHPLHEKIEELGFKNLRSVDNILKLKNCVLYIDEPQLNIKVYDKKNNDIIGKLCSLCRQRNIKLIMSTSDTRIFTIGNEAYFDTFFLKRIENPKCVKRGSRIKDIIMENNIFGSLSLDIENDEFIIDSHKYKNRGVFKYREVEFFDDELSNPYLYGEVDEDLLNEFKRLEK